MSHVVPPLRERVGSVLVGTPLYGGIERMRWLLRWRARCAHPELAEVHAEGARVERLLRETLRPDSTTVDVGCHLGVVLQRLVALAPQGRHIALEPVPYKAAWLRRKFPGVQVIEVAASEADGTAELTVDRASSAYSGLRAWSGRDAAQRVVVSTCRLDSVLAPDVAPALIKVDVNGGELGVLRGAVGTIGRHRPRLLLELTAEGLANYATTPADVIDFLGDTLQYRLYLPKDHFHGGPALDAARFAQAMRFPMQAFNFIGLPVQARG